MAIDPWVYVSGAPPASGSTPYRANSKVQSGQGFASFLRSSFDQAMAENAPSRPSVKHQTSSGSHVLRGKVDLGARPVFASAPQSGQVNAAKAQSGQVDAAKAQSGQVNAAKAQSGQVNAAKAQSGQVNAAKAQAGQVNAAKAQAGRYGAGESNTEKAQAPERAVSTGEEQPTEEVTSPLTAEEESVLRVVAALQSRSVKTSTRPPRHSSGKTAKESVDDLDTSSEEVGGSGPMGADLDKLAKTAKSQMGRRYVRGGDSPKSGFDCSGFTNWVYGEAGVDIARNSRAQFQEGAPVSRDKLQKGDLVFFGSKKRVHHVGLYLGDGQFIHSASSGGAVRISSLDNPFWSRTYAGARRVVVQSAAKEGHKQG